MATPLTLEGCAELRAEMEAGHLRDDVLVRVGLGVDEWTAAQTEWLEKMGAEIERGRFELTHRYSHAFLERQRVLGATTATTIDARGERAPPLGPAPTSPALPAVATPVPSFLLPISPPVPAPVPIAAAAQLAGTSMGAIAPKGAALPFAKAPMAPPRPAVNRAPTSLSGTSMGAIAPKGAALPFAKAPAPLVVATAATGPMAPLCAAPAGPGAGLPFDPRATMAPDPSAVAGTDMPSRSPLAPALPFSPSAAPKPLPLAASAPQTAPALAPPRAPAPDPMDMTTMGAPSPFAPVMPFGPAPARPPATAPAPPSATAPAPVAAAAAPAPVIIGGYTLEQHVSLCADLAFTPARASETLTRYHITAGGKAELDRLWKERFAADPALEARWREAHGIYLKFLGARRA